MTLEHLRQVYSKSKWPFFLVKDLIRGGVFDRDECDRLEREGVIAYREGMHGELIELLKFK